MRPWLDFFRKTENTPAYVYDIAYLQSRVNKIKNNLDGCEICYAMKANPFLIEPLENFIDKYEVCSPGELDICKKRNIDMSKVVFSGVNKQISEVRTAIEYGVGVCTVESVGQLEKIQSCCEEKGVSIPVLIRLTSGNQFGIDGNAVKDIISNREKYRNIYIEGIQYYSGTQKKIEKIKDEIEMLATFDRELQDLGYRIDKLEYGPGLNIEYYNETQNEDVMLSELKKSLDLLREDLSITLEMGRFVSADCGSYITSVVEVKQNEGQNYCLVDGGINHVNYYGQVMGARRPPFKIYRHTQDGMLDITDNSADKKWIICGSLCTVADVLVRNLDITTPCENDLILFEKIGAYSVTEGIYLFLSRNLPKVYFYENDELHLVRDSYETSMLNCVQGER